MRVRAAAVLVLVLGALPARGGPQSVVAGPGGAMRPGTYTPPVAVAAAGERLTFVSADPLGPHNVVARAYGSDSRSWCDDYAAGRCPLFWTPVTPAGGTRPIAGTDLLVSGRSYDFYCQLHYWMEGTIHAV